MLVDVEELRAYLIDCCGSASFVGGGIAAMAELREIERAEGEKLCEMAEQLGVDVTRFERR